MAIFKYIGQEASLFLSQTCAMYNLLLIIQTTIR